MTWEAGLGAAGSIIGGLGSLASGLGIGFGKSGSNSVNKTVGQPIDEYWMRTMKNAKRYGISPLTALGVNPGMQPPAQRAGDTMNLAQMGQGLAQMMRSPGQKEIAELTLAQEKAKLDNMNLKNVGLKRQIDQLDTQTGIPGDQVSNKITETRLPLSHPAYASGIQEGRAVKGLYQLYRHPDNSIIKIPAEDAADYLSESVIDAAILQSKRWWRNLTRPAGRVSVNQLRKIRDELDDMENFMRQNGELRGDEYLQFSPNLGMPVVARAWSGKTKRLFRESTTPWKKNQKRYGGMLWRRN